MSAIEADGLPEGILPGEAPAGGPGLDERVGAGAEGPSPSPPSSSRAANGIRPGRCWGLALLAGLVAGVASWLGGEAVYGRFIPPLLATSGFPTVEQMQAAARANDAGGTLEAGVTAMMRGSALGLMLGLAGGALRGSRRAAAVAGLAGIVLGGLAAAAANWGLMPVYFRFYDPDKDDLLVALLVQGGIAAVLGAAAGAAFGAGIAGGLGGGPARDGRGLIGRTLLGGLLGAAAGLVLFQVAGVLAFPLDQTTKPVSTSSLSRLANHILVALLAAAGAARGALQAPGPREAR
jgi:hypothetical protein